MMFIQEAMTGARLLRLNEDFSYEEDELIANKVLVMQKERHQNASDIQICPMAIAACAQLQASLGHCGAHPRGHDWSSSSAIE
jgi:hypothetical protein